MIIEFKRAANENVINQGFTRDVSEIDHFGTGDLEITLRSSADLKKAAP